MYKIKLTTDFRDWYDHIFYSGNEKCDAEIIRIAHDPKYSISKPEQFNILGKRLKLNVPIHGNIQDWANRISPDTLVVVYLDEFAHQGEAKELMTMGEGLKLYPEKFFSVFIDTATDEFKSTSHRYLQMGDRAWRISYSNPETWLSNVGESVEIRVMFEDEQNIRNRDYEFCSLYPIFAIDFVMKNNTLPLAIDFSTAPGTKYTGLDKICSATDIYDAISRFVQEEQKRRYVYPHCLKF